MTGKTVGALAALALFFSLRAEATPPGHLSDHDGPEQKSGGAQLSRPAQIQAVRLAPKRAGIGELVTITGRGLAAPGNAVRVGAVPAVIVCATNHRLTFRVPAGVNAGPTIVVVTTADGRVASLRFEVLPVAAFVLDDSHMAIATIGPEGGSVTAESRRRTFTLTIPPGALLENESIVLTPVAAIRGSEQDRLIGAVHFAPEGLQFLKPAMLEIALPPHADTRHMIGFGASGNGEDLHATPVGIGATFRIPLAHFSAAGLASFESAAIFSCQADTLECTFTTELAAAFAAAEQKDCQNDCATPDQLAAHVVAITDDFRPAEIRILDAWFTQVLARLNTTGAQTDDGLINAVKEFATWAAWVNGYPCGSVDCADDPLLAADLSEATTAVAADLGAALIRSHDACSDLRTAGHIAEVDALDLLGVGGLPATDAALKGEFACQLDIEAALPATAAVGHTVPLPIALNVRGNGGMLTPLPGVPADLTISDGCGTLGNPPKRTSIVTTGPDGRTSSDVHVDLPCVGSQHSTTIRIAVGDVEDESGELVALGRELTLGMAITSDIEITPQNQTVEVEGTVGYEASGPAASLFTWTATGGTITPGPSATAIYTAGNTPGLFSVTATLVGDPSQSLTVAVIVQGSPAGVIRQSSQSTFHFVAQTVDNGGICFPVDADPEISPDGATGSTLSGGCTETFSDPTIGVSETASVAGSITFAETYSGTRLIGLTGAASANSSASSAGDLPQQTGGASGNTSGSYYLTFAVDRPTTITAQGSIAGAPIGYGGGAFAISCDRTGGLASFVQSAPGGLTMPQLTVKSGGTCELRINAGAASGTGVSGATGSISVTVTFGS